MTTPRPTPGPPARGAQSILSDAGVDALLLPTGSSKSKYGLGVLAADPVNVGGLFGPVTNSTMTAEEVVKMFATSLDRGTIAQIQQMLLQSRVFYPADYMPHYGQLNAQDIAAFAKATETAAQTGSDLQEYLRRQAKFGEYNGVAAAMGNNGKPRVIQKHDPLRLQTLIDAEFKQITGRKATDAERAGFVAAYNAAFSQAQNAKYDSVVEGGGDGALRSFASPDFVPVPEQTGGAFGFGNLAQVGGAVMQNARIAEADEQNMAAQPVAPDSPASVVDQEWDPESFAENWVREQAAGDGGAHDVANQFSNFLSLLGGNR